MIITVIIRCYDDVGNEKNVIISSLSQYLNILDKLLSVKTVAVYDLLQYPIVTISDYHCVIQNFFQ